MNSTWLRTTLTDI